MKKIMSFFRKNLLPIIGIFTLVILFGSCKKSDVNNTRTPAAGLMAFNLIPNSGGIGVAIGNNSLTPQALYFNNYTGTYKAVFTGDRTLESYSFGSGSTLAKENHTFRDSSYYSVFVMGANDVYSNVFVEDSLQNIPNNDKTKTFVRFVNAIPDSSSTTVTISNGGTNIFNSISKFKEVSEFKEIPSGDALVKLNNESTINTSRTITLEKGKIYTVLLTGIPESTNSDFKVDIKFITNATL
jgi:hypothetical protein